MLSPGGRTISYALALVGLGHLVAPGILLGAARWGYDLVLDVEFTPRAGATRRVRIVGLAFVAVGLSGARLLGDEGGDSTGTRHRHR